MKCIISSTFLLRTVVLGVTVLLLLLRTTDSVPVHFQIFRRKRGQEQFFFPVQLTRAGLATISVDSQSAAASNDRN